MRTPPPYIEQSGLLDAPAEFPWRGAAQHFGPSQGTKTHDVLRKLATCGIVTVAALATEWLLWRFRSSIDLERYLHYVDATLAWEIDVRYRDQTSLKGSIPEDTPVNQALGDAIWMLRKISADEYQTEYPETNVHSTASLASIIKQVLPAKSKKAFWEWFKWAAARATEMDRVPRGRKPVYTDFGTEQELYEASRPHFGKPVPREALDPDSGFKPRDREAKLAALLQRLDHKKNPFLRSPAQLRKLGFPGRPYELE